MGIFQSIITSASGMTAERLRMDVIANNIANANTTRTDKLDANGNQVPYRRQVVVFTARDSKMNFSDALNRAATAGNGVRVAAIAEDQSEFKSVYDPNHPDASTSGYVRLPNINPMTEMVDLISASRAYEANVTVINSAKSMVMKALEIGRG